MLYTETYVAQFPIHVCHNTQYDEEEDDDDNDDDDDDDEVGSAPTLLFVTYSV
jgi:hypothetical protein